MCVRLGELNFGWGKSTGAIFLGLRISKFSVGGGTPPRRPPIEKTLITWRFTILWLRSVCQQYFNNWFVSFKKQDVNFSKTEKNYICKHVKDHKFMASTWKEGEKLSRVCRFLLFLNKRSIVHFCRWRGLWVTQMVISCGRHKCMTPKWFKIITYSVIRGSSFFFNIKPDTFWLS